jgi:hypothetical protein
MSKGEEATAYTHQQVVFSVHPAAAVVKKQGKKNFFFYCYFLFLSSSSSMDSNVETIAADVWKELEVRRPLTLKPH